MSLHHLSLPFRPIPRRSRFEQRVAPLNSGGVFGELSEFRRKFANPILRGREPTATREERQKAEERCRAMRVTTGTQETDGRGSSLGVRKKGRGGNLKI